METLHTEIHIGRTTAMPAIHSITKISDITGKVGNIHDKSKGGLESELWGLYSQENTTKTRDGLLKFLRNPKKIRIVDITTLCEVRNGFGGAANKGDTSVDEIIKLISEELKRRDNVSKLITRA